jgi:16S rRNA (guanine527-N7)-methyltransferase
VDAVKEILTQGLASMGLTPPPDGVEKLCRYGELLLEQNQVMNLTAITEPPQVARLHFLDSAAILAWGSRFAGAADSGGKSWLAGKTLVDVGTGAGFPGVVLKILEPALSLTLVDSLGKRVAWLEKVCEALSLDGVRCLHARAEELALEPGFRDGFDVATSRAVAAFPALCELCLPYVKPGGVFLAMKSLGSGGEVEEGQNAVNRLGGKAFGIWDYPIPGTDASHRIVGVEKVSPTPKGLPRSWGKIKKAPL